MKKRLVKKYKITCKIDNVTHYVEAFNKEHAAHKCKFIASDIIMGKIIVREMRKRKLIEK